MQRLLEIGKQIVKKYKATTDTEGISVEPLQNAEDLTDTLEILSVAYSQSLTNIFKDPIIDLHAARALRQAEVMGATEEQITEALNKANPHGHSLRSRY